MHIGNVRVGTTTATYFIAEAGVNHNGDIDMAERLIDVAAEAGADAVKFQTFSADRLVRDETRAANYQTEATGDESQHEILKQYELDRDAHEHLIEYCECRDVTFLSTPFDTKSADMLAELGLRAMKISSGDLDNHPFLEHVAKFGIPMIVSTGMGTLEEVRSAREVIRATEPETELSLLHCTSAYPCSLDDVNLRAMETMDETFEEPIGYSDHTTRPETPAFAAAAGATLVEKHFTLDSTLPGPDNEASLEPEELSRAIELVRVIDRMRGNSTKEPLETERENRQLARKSLHAAESLEEGTQLEAKHLQRLRPADGLSPRYQNDVIGATTTRKLEEEEPITVDDITEEL